MHYRSTLILYTGNARLDYNKGNSYIILVVFSQNEQLYVFGYDTFIILTKFKSLDLED